MPPLLDIAPGLLLESRYRIRDRIGEGGMGVVYRATDEHLHRPIALKFLSTRFCGDIDRLGRFRNEARALSALNHPHIVSVYDVGQIGDTPFIVMELVDGQTLRERLRAGRLPLGEALGVTLQVARALAAAHEKGLIHHDIKPENVMIRRDGYVKVLDFGLVALARRDEAVTSLTSAASLETVLSGFAGTPAYMSPEQIDGQPLDARTDVFSLGVVLCEVVTGTNPFARASLLETVTAIEQAPAPAERVTVDTPPGIRDIVVKALQRAPGRRYQTASDLVADLQRANIALDRVVRVPGAGRRASWFMAAATVLLLGAAIAGGVMYRRSERRHWVFERAIPEIVRLTRAQQSVAAFRMLQTAERYAPGDPALASAAAEAARVVSIQSSPPGAQVDVQDYSIPGADWFRVGTTPLERVRIPGGYLRWRVTKAGIGESITAPLTAPLLTFDLEGAVRAPTGMVHVPGGTFSDALAFVGWLGPYELPSFFIDRFEVTNREYQSFVDRGGYTDRAYWKQPFLDGGRTLAWSEAMDRFRDATGRPGPSAWSGGHFPEGRGEYPVTGVSWFEAAAYAEFAGKELPVIAQGYYTEPPDLDQYVLPLSNLSMTLAAVGTSRGLGVYGTYDLIGNAREWYWNDDGSGMRYTLGRQPASYGPEALPAFDRSPLNGFRCVKNSAPLPKETLAPRPMLARDFSKASPASDETFRVYRAMYAYDPGPLNAVVENVPDTSEDWRKEKITFNAAYENQRMMAYLFLPKHAHAPYQAVAFFPSARVNFLADSSALGDLTFMDYVVQSGRAVIYPIYDGLYERHAAAPMVPGLTVVREQVVHWSKDLGRSIDYLLTRSDIDGSRLGYLGVSQGTAYGVNLAAVEQRIKAVVLLDGGFLQYEHSVEGLDPIDFAPRLTQPVLMVNGRFDATFPVATAQVPLFRLLGAPTADKRHVMFDTPHDVRLQRADLVKEVLAWYDRYLGRVQ